MDRDKSQNHKNGGGIRQAEEPPDDLFDNMEQNLATSLENEGFLEGFEVGSRDGRLEGQKLGEQMGAKRGSELGYLHGYALTFKQLLFPNTDGNEHSQQSMSREERLVTDLLKLIDEYPRTNEKNCEDQIQAIRLKFRQAFGVDSGDLISSRDVSDRSQEGIRQIEAVSGQKT